MIPLQQKVLCRSAFLLVCILPTFVHVWSIFTSPGSRLGGKELPRPTARVGNPLKKPNQEDKEIGKQESAVGPVENLVTLSWVKQQGIEVAESPIAQTVSFQKSKLPDPHWLRTIPSAVFSVKESSEEVSLYFPELTVSGAWVRKMQEDLLAGKLNSIVPVDRKLKLQVGRLTVRRFDNSAKQELLRDLILELSSSAQSIIISGRRAVTNSESKLLPENPFELEASWANGKTTMRLESSLFPVWLLGNGFADIVGASGELSGVLDTTQMAGRSPSVQFKGQIHVVDCEKLSSWFNPAKQPFGNGTCQILCQEFQTDDQKVLKFVGELKSETSGILKPDVVTLLGNQAFWSLEQKEPASYRSFLFVVNYQDNLLWVTSKFEGKELAWRSDGTAVLSAR